MPPRQLRTRAAPPLTAPSAAPTASTRPRRGTANQPPSAAVIQRSPPEETQQSIHLTVKSSPGRLRQATSGNVAGKRASRNSRTLPEDESDEDEEAMDLDDDDEEDAEGDEDEDMDMDAEGDEDDDDTPAPRLVVSTKQAIPVNPTINITHAQKVEAKEMAMDDDDDDDDLSDPESDLDDEDAEGEDEDAEGEDDDEAVPANDDDMDSDGISRGQTPDVSKMTKRQRALLDEGMDGGGLMALSNEAQKKKHFTAEENAMRRAEMARRRKNLSEKRNEEEKVCMLTTFYVAS
jgi:Ino eighty subunit 2